MTLAVGFKYRDGVLLGAETELGDGDYKTHGSKLMPFDCPYGRVGIVAAGHIDGARRAMQAIRKTCVGLQASEHPFAAIEDTFGKQYKRIVKGNPHFEPGNDMFDFQLVIAVQGRHGGVELYHSNDHYLLETELEPVLCGTGRTMAQVFLDQSSTARSDRGRLIAFVSQLLAFGKRYGYGVGGISLFMDFGRDGSHAAFFGDEYLRQIETFSGVYQTYAWELATAMMSPDLSERDFELSIAQFADRLRAQYGQWKDQRAFHVKRSDAYRQITSPRELPTHPPSTHGRPNGTPSPE